MQSKYNQILIPKNTDVWCSTDEKLIKFVDDIIVNITMVFENGNLLIMYENKNIYIYPINKGGCDVLEEYKGTIRPHILYYINEAEYRRDKNLEIILNIKRR